MAALDRSRWSAEQNGIRMWHSGVIITDDERELYERARNAAKEAEREGDAQLQAAVAAARAVNQSLVAPTHLDFWSLKFRCDRLEAAYVRKSTSNTECYDYVPLLLKISLCMPHVYLILRWLGSPSHLSFKRNLLVSGRPELTFCELWSIAAFLACLVVLGIQFLWPLWYRSNRGCTLKYLVMSLWVWESVKLFLNTNDAKYILVEAVFANVFMSVFHRVPFPSHIQLRSLGGAMQAVAIACKHIDVKMCLQILTLSFVGHVLGLGLTYLLDWYLRKQFLKSLPVWLLDDLSGSRSQAQFYLSYRASLSRQMWSIFYPEFLENPPPSGKAVAYCQNTPRRALGGFAGGFGGVSSLKCARPISSIISPLSPSTSLSGGGSSDSSSGHWDGSGQANSGFSRGEIGSTVQDISGHCTREPDRLVFTATTSACSQVGLEAQRSHYMLSRPSRGGATSGYYSGYC